MNTVGQILIFSILKTITAIVFAITSFFPLPLSAQWQDTFADGEFQSDPAWQGDASAFAVENQILRLNATKAGAAMLATQHGDAYGIWEFEIGLEFNPSASNLARIYLVSDQPDLSVPLKGYFIQVGGSADEIALYKQDGETRLKIIDGTDGRLDLSSVVITIRVTRSPTGNWHVLSKLENETSFVEEGSSIDDEFKTSSWFGILCTFTSTRQDRFFFDNFSFEPESPVDTTAPSILTIEAIASDRLHVVFSEPVSESVLSNPETYLVSDGIGHPAHLEPLPGNEAVTLLFMDEFKPNVSYMLIAGPFYDNAGNESATLELEFMFLDLAAARWKDVIITEVFCDPSPSVGLPESEFIELFNRSASAVSVANWTLSDLTGSTTIKEAILLPGEYLILTPAAALAAYEAFGKSCGLAGFPSLNNARDAIILRDETGAVIDSIHYDDSWYRDSEKKSGGWSIELIDPANICAEMENWAASQSGVGGTPGTTNSIYAEKPDLTGPRLTRAHVISDEVINLIFNEKLENRVPESVAFEFSGGIGVRAVDLSPNLSEVKVHLNRPVEPGIIYNVLVRRIFDCAGNAIAEGDNRVEFAVAEPSDSHDVVINEILFNPRPNGADFVELINRSKKNLDLNGWSAGVMKDGECIGLKPIMSAPHLLRPDSIFAVTSDPQNIRNEYLGARNLWEAVLPPFNDDSGSVCITNAEGMIIDQVEFDEKMHSPFIRDKEGVSLERLAKDVQSGEPSNWKSAASAAGFATPGYLNSSNVSLANADTEIRIEPEIFMAVNGVPDFATIHYAFDQANLVANIGIFDSGGRLVKTVTRNALLGTSGFFRWEGDMDDGARARVGSYMVKVELFDQTGTRRVILKRVVVSGRF